MKNRVLITYGVAKTTAMTYQFYPRRSRRQQVETKVNKPTDPLLHLGIPT